MVHDDYLRCMEYRNKPAHPTEAGFVAFYDEQLDRHFFAMLDKDRLVMLRSEAYETEKSRETGIQAVIKNRPLPERYVIKQEGGLFYLILRAGNRKEIARSCEFETEAQAKVLLEKMLADDFERNLLEPDSGAGEAEMTPELPEFEMPTPVAVPIPAPEKDDDDELEERIAAPERTFTAAYSSVHIEYTDPETGLEYPALDHYLGHATLHDEHGCTGYAVFSGADHKHYFVVYNADGSIYQRSSGFASAEERDSHLARVRNAIVHADRYRVIEVGDKYAVALVDQNDQELSRSGLYDSFTEAFSKTPAAHQMPGSGNIY